VWTFARHHLIGPCRLPVAKRCEPKNGRNNHHPLARAGRADRNYDHADPLDNLRGPAHDLSLCHCSKGHSGRLFHDIILGNSTSNEAARPLLISIVHCLWTLLFHLLWHLGRSGPTSDRYTSGVELAAEEIRICLLGALRMYFLLPSGGAPTDSSPEPGSHGN
jgi:hypothetical protein